MTESVKSKNDIPLEISTPDGAVSLESILCTEELRRRPWRAPDYEKENRALTALASALADFQPNILQTLAETILDVTQCDSSGLSLLTKDEKRFYWPAIAGIWKPHTGGGTPRDFGPCGDVLDRNCTLLFQSFERRYPYLLPINPSAKECLLVPFFVGGKAVGTIWAIMHGARRKFDAEDERLMSTLGQFASLSYQTLASMAEAQRLSHTGSWHWNVRSGEFVWSQGFFAIFGFDSQKDKASHRLFIERIHPEDRSNVEEVLRASVERKSDFEVEYRLVLPGGLIKHLYAIGHCSVNQSGDVEYIGTVLDITERKRVEEEREGLRRLQANLAHINRVNTMGELTASLAHEIKQPISAAITNASACLRWLARDPPNMAEAQEAASKLIKDTTRASDIISCIVSLFKKDALQREFVDLNELIREMIVLLRSEATRFSISIHGELASDLPQIMADRVQLQQVFMNLMLNGIEAMKDMDPPGEITITSQQDENSQILVSVADTGVGLPEQVDQIFNAFFSSKSQGTGMGLPISRSIIESLGGRLWATSNFGPGATFWFTLPVEVTVN